MMMVPPTFLEWWFSPWANVGESRADICVEGDELARRDAYRRWCDEAGIAADFPLSGDWKWAEVVTRDVIGFAGAARLFMGIMAAGERDQALLSELPASERKWCVQVAATQPLLPVCKAAYSQADRMTTRGFVELAIRLEHGFPGLWPRLSLMLPVPVASRVAALMNMETPVANFSNASISRAQRCWRFCVIQHDLKIENERLKNPAARELSKMQEIEAEIVE